MKLRELKLIIKGCRRRIKKILKGCLKKREIYYKPNIYYLEYMKMNKIARYVGNPEDNWEYAEDRWGMDMEDYNEYLEEEYKSDVLLLKKQKKRILYFYRQSKKLFKRGKIYGIVELFKKYNKLKNIMENIKEIYTDIIEFHERNGRSVAYILNTKLRKQELKTKLYSKLLFGSIFTMHLEQNTIIYHRNNLEFNLLVLFADENKFTGEPYHRVCVLKKKAAKRVLKFKLNKMKNNLETLFICWKYFPFVVPKYIRLEILFNIDEDFALIFSLF